jgi:hypothetical protein
MTFKEKRLTTTTTAVKNELREMFLIAEKKVTTTNSTENP